MTDVYIVQKLENNKDIIVNVPGSKSITNRALMLAALSDGECNLDGVLFSDDSRAFLDCLEKLGFQLFIDENEKRVKVVGTSGEIPNRKATIDVRSAGTAARFLTVMLAVTGGEYTLNSSEQMKKRPMGEIIDLIRNAGVKISCLEEEGHFPFIISSNGLDKKEVSINTDTSSQYASALLMAAVMTGLKIKLTGKRVNGAYIKITLNMLKQFGIKYVQFEENKYNIEKQRFRLEKYQIEPDMSGACYFYAMSLMIKKKVLVKNLHLNSMQGDIKFLYALKKMGCLVKDTDEGIIIDGSNVSEYKGIEIDMNDTAVKAVSAMSSFYRNSLSKGQFIIPLRQELLLTEQYLYIQNLRYMDFVDYEITYEPSWEDHGAEIPKLTIQPVVENIFVHGLTSQMCHIHLNVSIRNGTICISVSDNGSGIPPKKLAELNRSIRDFKTARHSFGLPSINHRIALLYGENYGLTIESSPEKGTTVTIVIPDKNLIEGEI